MGRQTAAAEFSDSKLGPVSTFSVQAGKAKIVLAVLKNHAAIRVRIRSVTPDFTEVGGTLDEAKELRQDHDELTLSLGEKQAEIVAMLLKLEGRNVDEATRQKTEEMVKEAWKEINTQMEQRKMLLDQSVAFHSSALQFGKKMSQVEARCGEVPQAHDVETARRLIQQHQDMKKSVLEASMSTLQEGQLLLDRIRKMAIYSDVHVRHATTSGCYAIEQLLLNLQDKKRRLEELWLQRKFLLEQCIQLLLLDQDAAKVTKWLDEVGEVYLGKKDLGDSLDTANFLLSECYTMEQQFLAAPQTVRRLIAAVDYLTHPVAAEKDTFRQRFVALEQRCESFTSRLNVRRKNISLSAYFYALVQDAMLRLDEIEVLLTGTDLTQDSHALAERHTKLSQSITEASIAALHVGRTVLARNGKDDPAGAGINTKVTELQERCNRLQGLCTARPDPEKQPSEAITQLLDKYNKLSAWLKYVGQAQIDRSSDLGIGLADANDFLITHRALSDDFRTKQTEVRTLVTSVDELAKSGDQAATDLQEKTKKLSEQLEKLILLADKRSKLALAYVVLNKREQQISTHLRLLEEHLKQEKLDPSLIPEAAIRQREDAFRKVTADLTEIDRIGKQFLNDVNELKTTDQLNTEFVTRGVSLMLSNFSDRKTIVAEFYEHWKTYATDGRTFATQWKQYMQDARTTIDWLMKVEDSFFPKIAGELGSSLNEVQQHRRRLEDFKPTIKKAQEETEKHLKTAELLSLKGDTRGQRDQIVNELLKVHTRFQARIGEYRYLLNMATKFFENLQELDKLIATTEKEYANEVMPKEVAVAEESLRQHNADKTKLKQLIEFSSEEADQIITRVRQQDSEEVAKDEVQRVLQLTEEKRKLWEKAWDDHKKRLEQALQASQFYFDLKQLQDELDEIQRQLNARQGSYGNSLSSVKTIVQAFIQLEKLADLIGVRFKDFVGTADKMIQDRHYDSRRIRHEVDETEKRWNTVYNTIKSYRIALEASTKFFNTMDECDGWVNGAGQFLLGISRQAPQCKTSTDVDTLITLIQKYKQDGLKAQDGRLNEMERIATDLYGSVLGPEKMQHTLDKNQDMFNAFVKAIEDLMILKNNLINTEQILANVGAVVEKKTPRQPRFVQPLQNAEITEGQRFTFECRLECDTMSPVIQWLKDNEPVKGYVPSYKDGICRLTIDETMLRDSGSFSCQAKTEAGSTETSATLKVKELQQKVVGPEFSRNLKPLEVPEGTSCLLECYVSGIPFPTITWFRDDVPIANSPEHLITIDGGGCFLKIRKLNKDHTGLYKCKATNPGGEAVSSATVNVISVQKPEFTQPLKDAKVDEGKGIRLECRYTGDPAPQIQWLFNDAPILPSALFKIIVEKDFTALEIHEVFPEDCGNYTATAKNLGGEARTTCLLSLIGVGPTIKYDGGRKPEFVQPLQRTDVQEGGRAKLECAVIGNPEPEVLWYHNDKPIKKSKDFDISFSKGRCCLAINEVYLEDSGEYICTARNEHGIARTECRLVVEPLSELSDSGTSLTGEVPPKFTQLLKDIEGIEGELVRFECRVIGHPTPVIKWYCGRNQLSTSPEFEITSERELQTLTIPTTHKEDAGNYMVKATNNAGIAKCYATLIVKPGDKHAMKMRLIESSHSMQTRFIEGHKPPEVVKAFHDLHVRPGQPITMEVVILGTPRPKVQWLFNNEPIVSPDYKISSLGDVYSLHIPEVFDEDAGRFSVIAENETGKAWCSALLVVVDMSQLLPDEGSPPETPLIGQSTLGYGPPPVVQRKAPPQFQPVMVTAEVPVAPQFTELLKNVSAEEGSRAVFEIPVAGKPEPVIRWFKDGRQLIGGTAGLEVYHKDGRATLALPNVLDTDAGRYTCTATNVAGEASSAAELTVKASTAKPQFAEKLEAQNIREGESVRFRVRVTGKPSPQVTWYREGVQIISSPDFSITHVGDIHTLYIPEVFREDSGKFSVKVTSPTGQSECFADLRVEGTKVPSTYTTERSFDLERKPPQFVKPLSNKTVQVGQRVTLECAIPPYPVPEKVQWYHNEIEIFISPQHQISYSNGNCLLSLAKAVPESRGRYICTVIIDGLKSSTDMNLEVIGEPEITREAQIPQFRDKLRHIKYAEGQEVVFVCQVAGHPPPNIQWFHSGRLIRPSKKYEMKLTKEGVCSLRIKNVGPEDVGIYTCSATNVAGQEYSSAELYVPDEKAVDETSYVSAEALRRMMHSPGHGLRDRDYGGVSEQYFKPIFRKIPNDLEVPEGSMARFDSIVAGRPIPDMLWFRDGTRVFDDRLHKIVINEEGINSLIIDITSVSDAGLYTCIARNRAGEDKFQVRLNVQGRQAASAPRFTTHMNNQTVREGDAVTFTVEADGFPIPMLSWQKDGYHITSSDHYQIRNEGHRSTLHIPVVRPEDNAWFQCTAASAGGVATSRVRLVIQAGEPQVQQRTYIQSMSPGPSRRVPTPVGRTAASPDSRREVNIVLAPSPGARMSPWQQPQQYAEEVMSRTALEMQTKRTEYPFASEAAPQLIEPMKDQQVVEGVTSHFRCKVYSATEPHFEWFFNNRPIHPSHKYHISAENGVYSLSIAGTSIEDGGVYKCIVTNKGGDVTCIAHLRVGSQMSRLTPAEHIASGSEAPHFVRSLTDITTTIGGSVNFDVSVGNQPSAEVFWFLNGRPIQPSENFQMYRSNGTFTLRIKQVTPDAIGTYTCRVVGPHGPPIETTARLTIQGTQARGEPPQFTRPLQDLRVADGTEVSLRCTVIGQPKPQVSWYHNGKNIDKSTDFAISYDDRTGVSELLIVDCMRTDQGHFKCIAKNDVGQAETGCHLTVVPGTQPGGVESTDMGFLKEVKEKPVVPEVVPAKRTTPIPVVTSVESPEEAIIPTATQAIRGGPADVRAIITQPVEVVEEVVRPVMAESKTIAVPDLSKISQTKVTSVVEISQGDAPRFTQPIQPCVVVEGQSCTFNAVVVGEPWPEITWLKEKQDMLITQRHKVSVDARTGACSLTITNCHPLDTGVYSCRATNAAGRATCTANIVVVPPNVEVTVTEKTMSVKKEKVTTMGDQEIRTVESSPTFKEALPPLLEVNEGEPVRLQCQISAEPEPNVSWFFNGNRVTSTHRVTLTFDKVMTVLAIPCTTLADTGEYICTAKNPLGEAHTKTFLRVKKLEKELVPSIPGPQPAGKYIPEFVTQPVASGSAVEVSLPIPPMSLTEPCSVIPLSSPQPEAPKFVVPLRNQTVKDGDIVKFTVHFIGNPIPEITWYINGKPVEEDGDFQVTVDTVKGESTLTIREVFPDDEGEFTCKAVNVAGTAISNSHMFVVASSSSEEEQPSTEMTTVEQQIIINRELLKNLRNQQETIVVDRKPQPRVVELTLGTRTFESTLDTDISTSDQEMKRVFVPIPVRERKEKDHTLVLEKRTEEELKHTEVIKGHRPSFSETVSIDRTDQRTQTVEFELKPEKKTTKSELLVHRESLPKGMKMEQLLLLERNVKKHEISEALLASQVFSETIAIDATDQRPQTLEFEMKQLKSSELLVHQEALPQGYRMEAEVLESLKKTSRLDLARSKYIEAIENQRQELLLNLDGAAPRFVREIQSQKVMDGGKVKFIARVIGNPMPEEVTWFHDRKSIRNNPDFHLEYDRKTGDCSLLIGELFPQDGGLYECVAENKYGEAVTEATLTVEAYEYVPDSEESYTSQGESSISTSSAMETLRKVRIQSQEVIANFREEAEFTRITERRDEEIIHIADVKWCTPKYAEPITEMVKHEDVQDLSKAQPITAGEIAVPQISEQVCVEKGGVSRVHTLQERTNVEEIRTLDVVDTSEKMQRGSIGYTSPLASPAVSQKTEARVPTLLEHFHEERLANLQVEMTTPQVPVCLAISELEKVKVGKSVGAVFVKPGQLPTQHVGVTDTIKEVFKESGRTEIIQVEMGTSRAKDIPSSFAMTLSEREDTERVEHLKDDVPSPQITTGENIPGNLVETVASRKHTLVSQVVEVHSEGEEEEIFHDAVEPALPGKEVITENLVNVSVRGRPYSLASSQATHHRVESTGAEIHVLIKETPFKAEIPSTLESAFKKLPSPSQVRTQEEIIQVTVLRDEENLKELTRMSSMPQVITAELVNLTRGEKPVNQASVIQERTSPERLLDEGENKIKEITMMVTLPELITLEYEQTKKEEKPFNRVPVIEDRLSPEKTVVKEDNYDEIAMNLSQPELIQMELQRLSVEGKPVNRVQTVEDRLSFESTLGTEPRIEDLSMILSVPEVIHTEFVTTSTDGKPISRALTVEDRVSPDRVNVTQTVGLDEMSLKLSAAELISVELVSTTKQKPVNRAQELQDRSSASSLTVNELKADLATKEFCKESVEIVNLYKADKAAAKHSLVRVQVDKPNFQGADEFDAKISVEQSRTEIIESQLARSFVRPEPHSQVLITEETTSHENIPDVRESDIKDTSMVSIPELIALELVTTKREEKPVNRTRVIEDRISPEKMIDVKAKNLDDMAMTLPAPSQISSDLIWSSAEGKPVTRTLTIEDRISPDRIGFTQSLNLNNLAQTAPAGQVTITKFDMSSTEEKPVSRVLISEDRNLPEDIAEVAKLSLANIAMMLSAAEIEYTKFVSASKEGKPVTRAIVQEDRERSSEVFEKKISLNDLLVTAFASLISGTELASAIKEFLLSQVRLSEEMIATESHMERRFDAHELLVKALSSQISAADLVFPIREQLISQVQITDDRQSLESAFEKSSNINDLLMRAIPSAISSEDLAFAMREKLLSQAKLVEQRISPDRIVEKRSNTAELLANALSSQIAVADLAFALRERLISMTRVTEERKPVEQVTEWTSSTAGLLVSALSSQISAADLAFSLREQLFSHVRTLEERLSTETVYERCSGTSELLTSAMTSYAPYTDMMRAVRENTLTQVRPVEEGGSPDRIVESSSLNMAGLVMNLGFAEPVRSEMTWGASGGKMVTMVKPIEERKSPEKVVDSAGINVAGLVMNLGSPEAIRSEWTWGTSGDKTVTMVKPIEERKSPEKVFDSAGVNVAGLVMNLGSPEATRSELTWGMSGEKTLTMVKPVEERKSPEKIVDSAGLNVAGIMMNLGSPEATRSELTWGMSGEKTLTMVKPVEERKSPEKIVDSAGLSTAGLLMNLGYGEQIRSDLTWGMATDKTLTMVKSVEERHSPERINLTDVGVTKESGYVSEVPASTGAQTQFIRKHRSQTLVLPQVIRLHLEAANKFDSVTGERSYMTDAESAPLSHAAVKELQVYMNKEEQEHKEIITEFTYFMKKEPTVQKDETIEIIHKPKRQEITKETEYETTVLVEEWEVMTDGKKERSPSETRSINEEWEETVTTAITTEKDLEVRKEPEQDTQSLHEEWEETLTTQTTTETDLLVKKPKEDLSETESLHEQWEETITTETTTEKDIFVKKEKEPEDLTETSSLHEEWEETIKTTTITEQDLIVAKEPEPETLSETESLKEEWSETLTTETTVEKDITVQKESDKESLSETESMHEEWSETQRTITIVESDVIVGLMERIKFDQKGLLVCKEAKTVKETAETQEEGVDVTDKRLVVSTTGLGDVVSEKETRTETFYKEPTEICKERINYGTGILFDVPYIDQRLQPLTVSDGSRATLTCGISGYPPPEVKWFVDGMEIKQSADFKMTYENGICMLVINDVLPEDEGEYSVTATNTIGSCKTSAYLTVKHSTGAEITARQKTKAAKLRHSSVEEVCSSGEETSSALTIEEGKVFEEFKNLEINVALKRKGVIDSKYDWLQEQSARQIQAGLDVTDLTKDGAITRLTEGQTEFKQVVVSPRAGQAPVFVTQLESRDVFESTPVKLECDVKGFPQPEITWYQDGKRIHQDEHMKLSYNQGRCTLFIDRVTIDDEAEYVCEARNEYGVATSWAELLVEKLIEGLEQLVMEEFYELEIEMQFKWKPRTDAIEEQEA